MSHVVFVAGATGHTGREVVRLLGARGVRTIAHVRPDSARLDAWRGRFEAAGAEISTAPWEQAAMDAELARIQPTAVFALLGTTKRRQRQSQDPARNSYEAVDYGLTALLLRSALAVAPEGRAASGARFVYLSSMGVGPRARGAYLEVRWRLEQELQASGLPWAIARPSFILGERDQPRAGERIGGAVGDALLGAIGALGGRTIRDQYRSMTGAELAAQLIRLGLEPGADGRVYEAKDLRG